MHNDLLVLGHILEWIVSGRRNSHSQRIPFITGI